MPSQARPRTAAEETPCRSISKSRRKPRPSAKACANGCMTNASPPRRSWARRRFDEVLAALRKKARAQGLWCPFIPKEYGGMGLGPLANALVQMELGESYLGALSMNTQGPDDATMLTLLEHGTDYQKEKFLKPLLNGEKRICYLDDREGRRRRRHRHADPRGEGRQRELCAERREVVLVGRQRRRHRAGHGQDRPRRAAPPAVLDLPRRAAEPRLQHQARHQDHGGRRSALRHIHGRRPFRDRDQGPGSPGARICSAAKATASTWASIASPTAGCATACTTSPWRSARSTWRPPMSPTRSTFGKPLAERQAVQFMLAECASQLYIAA